MTSTEETVVARSPGLTRKQADMLRQVAAGRVTSRADGVYWFVDGAPAARQFGRTLRELLAAGLTEVAGAAVPDANNATPVTLSADGRVRLYGPTGRDESATSADAEEPGDDTP